MASMMIFLLLSPKAPHCRGGLGSCLRFRRKKKQYLMSSGRLLLNVAHGLQGRVLALFTQLPRRSPGSRGKRRRNRPMLEPRANDEALQGLDAYERMLDTFAEQAKAYWGLWGMMGEHMVRNVDSWAIHQRSYVQWLRHNRGLENQRS